MHLDFNPWYNCFWEHCFYEKCLCQIWFHVLFHGLATPAWRWILGSLYLILARLWWWSPWIESGRRDIPWFPRLDWKRTWSSLYLFPQDTCPQNPDAMLWGSSRHMERPHLLVWSTPSPRSQFMVSINCWTYNDNLLSFLNTWHVFLGWGEEWDGLSPDESSPRPSSHLQPMILPNWGLRHLPACPCLKYWPNEWAL